MSSMPHRHHAQRAALLVVALLLATLLVPSVACADGVVYFYYFYDPQCSSCDEVHSDVLEPLLEEHGDALVMEARSIADAGGFELLLALEQRFGVTGGSIPEVFIGEDALVGPDAIKARLGERVAYYLAQGGAALPETGSAELNATPTPTTECEECDAIHDAAREAAATRSATEGTSCVEAVLFWSETCGACHEAREEVLPGIVSMYGDRLRIRAVNLTGGQNADEWDATMEALGIPQDHWYIPMLIVGDRVLIGGSEFAQELPPLVDALLEEGGAGLPDVPGVSFVKHPLYQAPSVGSTPTATEGPPPAVYAVYFRQTGCDDCERSEHDLAYIAEQYPQLVIERHDVRQDAALNQYLCDLYGVPEDKHLTAPALFLGNGYLLDDQIRAPAIEALLTPYLTGGAPSPATGWEEEAEAAAESIVERFRSFGLLTVVGAGLLDGVNPCAFATMIFLVSYLTYRKRQGRELLLTGLAFTLGVFLTYLAVGLGLLRFLESLPFLNAIGKWIYGATAVLCLGLAWGSIVDYRRAREGRLEDMSLKLPARLREFSKRLIREGTGSRRFVLSAFLLGLGVSLVELACTGQVYLPTIIFVLGVPEWRGQATLALLTYNAMFVVPLVGVFMLVYYGTTSQQLVEFLTKRAAPVKLGMAVLFVVLAGWLVYGIVA